MIQTVSVTSFHFLSGGCQLSVLLRPSSEAFLILYLFYKE